MDYLHLRGIHEAINGNCRFFFPETDTFLFLFFFLKPNWSLKKNKTWSRNVFSLWKTINITSKEQTTAYKYKRDLKEKDCEDPRQPATGSTFSVVIFILNSDESL